MSLPLLQLSSISTLFNMGDIAQAGADHPMSSGEAAIAALIVVPAAIAYAKADPHWNTIRTEKGHFDHGIDEGCIRLARLSPEALADIESMPAARREFFRRMMTSSHSWRHIVSRLKREDVRRQEAAV